MFLWRMGFHTFRWKEDDFLNASVLSTGTIKGYEGPINEVPDNKQERYQALHHQFVASAKVIKYAHDNYPQFKLGNMCIFASMIPTVSIIFASILSK